MSQLLGRTPLGPKSGLNNTVNRSSAGLCHNRRKFNCKLWLWRPLFFFLHPPRKKCPKMVWLENEIGIKSSGCFTVHDDCGHMFSSRVLPYTSRALQPHGKCPTAVCPDKFVSYKMLCFQLSWSLSPLWRTRREETERCESQSCVDVFLTFS